MRKDKDLAFRFRKEGKSYNQITKLLGVPKSTLSYWLKDNPVFKQIKKEVMIRSQKIWAKNIITYNKKRSKLIESKWEKFREEKSKEINKLSLKDLRLIGIALYWAKGYKKGKWAVMFCNADPKLVQVMMRFFREVCRVPKEKFRPSIQIHNNVSEKRAKKYWSRIANLPQSYFTKTLYQVAKSSKMKRPINTLPYGTFRLYISDVWLINKIKGWIEGIAKQGF